MQTDAAADSIILVTENSYVVSYLYIIKSMMKVNFDPLLRNGHLCPTTTQNCLNLAFVINLMSINF